MSELLGVKENEEWWPTGYFRWYTPDRRYFAEKLQQKFVCRRDGFERDGFEFEIFDWRDVPMGSIPAERLFGIRRK